MVAEGNKEVKKKRDGEGVNGIDEEELHDSCTGVDTLGPEAGEAINP